MLNTFQGLHILRIALRRNGPLQLISYLSNLDIARFIEYSKTIEYLDEENFARTNIVLDIGCGYSIFPIFLKEKLLEKCGEYVTLDLSLNACRYQASSGHQTLQIQGDMTHLPMRSSSIDAIIAISSIEHVSNDFLVFQEVSRVLRKDGVAIISFPYSRNGSKIARRRKPPSLLISLVLKFHQALATVFGGHLSYFTEQISTDSIMKYYSDTEIRKIISKLGFSLERRFYFGKYGRLLGIVMRFLPRGWFVVKDLVLSAVFLRKDSNEMDGRNARGVILKIRKHDSREKHCCFSKTECSANKCN